MSATLRTLAAAAACALLALPVTAQTGPQQPVGGKGSPLSGVELRRALARQAHPAPPLGAPPPPYIYHSTVNNPANDATERDTQLNTTIVDLGGGNLVAAFDDTSRFGGEISEFAAYAYSSNNGFNWTQGALPSTPSGNVGYPVLAHHKASGAVYLATPAAQIGSEVSVYRSTDSGHTFPTVVNGTPGFTGEAGRAWLAVDNFGAAGSGNGNVYLCAQSDGGALVLTRSTDGGATFGPSGGVVVSASGGGNCFIAVSPNHQINVFYLRSVGPDGTDNRLYLRRSRDRGLSFGGEVLVADLNTTTPAGDVGLGGGSASSSGPQAAVNPVAARPYIYVVYNDIDPAAPGAKSQVYYVRSTDNGTTFSAPARVNDDSPGSQYFPSIGFAVAGEQVMAGYSSRSQDPNDLAFHRRARLGVLTAGGAISFNQSFQIGPNTPLAVGQDATFGANYIGEYESIASSSGALASTWSDNAFASATHANQPDVRYARITVPPPVTDIAVQIATSTATVERGDAVVLTLTAQALSGTANDVFLATAPNGSFAVRSVATASGQCASNSEGVGCSLGTIAAGASKTVQIVVSPTVTGTVTLSVKGSTSSVETALANNSASTNLSVSAGGVATSNHTTGNIAAAIPDGSVVEIPIEVASVGTFVSATTRVRLNHTFDKDLTLKLISPNGRSMTLSAQNGGAEDNYGAAANDCSGIFTVFRDDVGTSIASGAAPFAGNFKPQQPYSTLLGVPTEGTWKLRVEDGVAGDLGTVGCVQLVINRKP